eukprot:scaffold145_cov195-Alexandrium_tamarense.AAC.11
MAKFSLPALALACASISTTSAFAPISTNSRPLTTTLHMSSVASSDSPPLSPLTVWGDKIPNIIESQNQLKARKDMQFAPTIKSSDIGLASNDTEGQLAYFKEHAMEIKQQMVDNGAVIFREFDLMKEQEGFVKFYEALGMKTCLDPLHSVSARPTVDGKKGSPVYEAVNKESRKNFFIGELKVLLIVCLVQYDARNERKVVSWHKRQPLTLSLLLTLRHSGMHNEFVGTRAPRAAAFVCFKAAESGGEFLIADGRSIFRDLNPELVEKLYNRNIRYSVMELPFFGWVDSLPEFARPPVMGAVKGLVTAAINAKVDFSVDMQWGEAGYDATKMLQARAPSQPPILIHPVTGEPHWFCNVHSHSSKLRKDRESVYGAERFEDGASQINKSDMFYGDDGDISDDDLTHMDEVTMKNVQFVKMTEGDVVLLDNYKCMHGRNVFDGTRKHGVAWFEGWEGEQEMKAKAQQQSKEAVMA